MLLWRNFASEKNKKNMKALKKLNQHGQHNWTKILCLAIGLAAGMVLVGKVGFELSWDNFFPASDRIYVVREDIIRDGEYHSYPQTAGGVAPGMKQYCPQVEAATRYTDFASHMPVLNEEGKRVRANFALVDSCFFDVFPFHVIAGDAKKTLSQPECCMIPRSLAEKLGGDIVGKKIFYNRRDGWALTVGGIYEDIPLNSRLHDLQVMVSMPTITLIMWDGRDNWVGNDRYLGYVRLAEGITPDDLKPQIEKMKRERLPLEELEKAGTELGFSLTPLREFHINDESTRNMAWILSLLAIVLIGCAVLNYLLLVVGGISRRAREMAVHKCYGAQANNLYGMVFRESSIHLLLSLLLAVFILWVAKDTVEELVGAPLMVLLTSSLPWLLVVIVVVLLLTGLLPGWLYNRIPVATAFKNYSQTHRWWKLLLLALQFAFATLLITLLAVVGRQYQLMVNDSPGYDYSTLGMIQGDEIQPQQRQLVIDELRKLSVVESVTTSTTMLTNFQSGDNILLPGEDREYMNVADLFYVGDGYHHVIGIPLVSGRTFTEEVDTLAEVMVSRSFEQRMQQLAGWDNAVGKQIICTSFQGPYTIVGVYEDVRMGSIACPDERPSVCFYSKKIEYMTIVHIRFHSMEGLQAANELIRKLVPDNPDVVIYPYSQIIAETYTDAKRFRSTVLIGGLVALVIALIGLVGYLAGEINRRQKEIAIRKVNGARTAEVLRLFLYDIMRVAIPSVVVGTVAAYAVAQLWLQQFSVKTPLSWSLFTCCALSLLAVILAIVGIGCYRVATNNPVGYLKNE